VTRLRALVIGATLMLASCAGPTDPGPEDLAIQRLSPDSGSFEYFSGFDASGHRVIRTVLEWSDVWGQIYKNAGTKPPLPTIDFSTEQVVLVALGTRPSSGYAIRLTGASRTGNGVVVRTETESPGAGCGGLTVLTQPIDVARMPRTSGSVDFEETSMVRICK
jgi:hypothetical protein